MKNATNMYDLPVVQIVILTLVLVFGIISIGIASFTISTHITTQIYKNLTGQEDFNNLTINGKLTVEGGSIFTESLLANESMNVLTEIKTVELGTKSFTFGGFEVPVVDFEKLKNQVEWFRVFLNPLSTLEFFGEISDKNNPFPFGRTMNDQNISAVGPVADEHFLLVSDNQSGSFMGTTATFAKFNNPLVATSTWLIEGSFGIDFIPELGSDDFQKPTAIDAYLAGTFLQNKLTQPGSTCTIVSHVNDITKFPDGKQYLNQMYNFPASVVSFPLLTPNDNKLCEYIGLNIFFGLDIEKKVGITIKNMDFTFKKLHQTLVK